MTLNNIFARCGIALCMATAPFAASATAFGGGITGLTFQSETTYATGTTFGGNTVFGLSGIDYDPRSGTFLSQRDNFTWNTGNGGNPVAFQLSPVFAPNTPGYKLAFEGVNTLGGAVGLSSIESIRFDPGGDGVWLASEGPNGLFHIAGDGTRTMIPVPDQVGGRIPAGNGNYGLEGLTFTPGGQMWVSREDTMDGDAAGTIRLSALGRDGSLQRQFAYRLDDVTAINNGNRTIANPPGSGLGNNGVSEILAVSDTSFLVMERAWDGIGAKADPTGVSHNYIRIYGVDLDGATDIKDIDKVTGATATVRKTLLFDSTTLADTLNTYETKVDNIEGMSFGPTLADGRRSLVLVSDNNNSKSQGKTQFLVFAVNGAVPEPATWAMMLIGFGVVGVALRRRPRAMAAGHA